MDDLIKLLLEENSNKLLIIIIKGNPKYTEDPKIKSMSDRFYSEIESILRKRGFEVNYDLGEEYTIPNTQAYAWVAHSRGVDRLNFAPSHVKTLALRTRDLGERGYSNSTEQGKDPRHYQLNQSDVQALKEI